MATSNQRNVTGSVPTGGRRSGSRKHKNKQSRSQRQSSTAPAVATPAAPPRAAKNIPGTSAPKPTQQSTSLPSAGSPALPAPNADPSPACHQVMSHLNQAHSIVKMGLNALPIGAFRSAANWADEVSQNLNMAQTIGSSVSEAMEGEAGYYFNGLQRDLAHLRGALATEVHFYGGLEGSPAAHWGEEALVMAITDAQKVAEGLIPQDQPETFRGVLSHSLRYIDGRLWSVGCCLSANQPASRADLQAVVAGTAVLSMLQDVMSSSSEVVESIRPLYRDVVRKVLDMLYLLCLKEGIEGAVFGVLGKVAPIFVHNNLRWIVIALRNCQHLRNVNGCIMPSPWGPRLFVPLNEVVYGPLFPREGPCMSSAGSGATSGGSSPRSEQGIVDGAYGGVSASSKKPMSRLDSYNLRPDAAAAYLP